MKTKGFTLIELIVVIVILGVLAATAAPKFINLKSDAQTATLEAIKASMEGAAALVHSKSLIKGNHKEAFAFPPPSPSVNLGGTSGNISVHYGYPLNDSSEWNRLIEYDSTVFNIGATGTSGSASVVIYPVDITPTPNSITDACIVYYTKSSGIGQKPTIQVNPCD